MINIYLISVLVMVDIKSLIWKNWRNNSHCFIKIDAFNLSLYILHFFTAPAGPKKKA